MTWRIYFKKLLLESFRWLTGVVTTTLCSHSGLTRPLALMGQLPWIILQRCTDHRHKSLTSQTTCQRLNLRQTKNLRPSPLPQSPTSTRPQGGVSSSPISNSTLLLRVHTSVFSGKANKLDLRWQKFGSMPSTGVQVPEIPTSEGPASPTSTKRVGAFLRRNLEDTAVGVSDYPKVRDITSSLISVNCSNPFQLKFSGFSSK